MRVLFIVQGEGRGHLTQALSLEKLLTGNGHEVVEVLVGKSESHRLPGFFSRGMHAPIKHFDSPNFLPTRANCRANIRRSVAHCLLKVPEYIESIRYIRQRIRKTGAEMVINFYELLTGLTYLFFRPNVPLVCIGHQYLFLHRDFRLPETNRCELFLMNLFTRITSIGATRKLALSFRPMKDDDTRRISVVPPLLREEVFEQEAKEGDYIHGYMVNSGFSEYVCHWHKSHPDVPLRFFWDHWEENPVKKVDSTLSFYQLDDSEFLRQMAGCKAYASTAGFESVCEAMYLGKPILMVPAHIEQECNAYDAARSGAGIVDRNFNLDKLLTFALTFQRNATFPTWVQSSRYIILNELEKHLPQDHIQGMYLVEEYV